MALTPLLGGYDQVILDLDGCVWIGPNAIPGSVDAIGAIREAGLRLAFVTNNSWYSGEDQVAKLWGLGVRASLADVVTVGGAMQHLLAESRQGRTAFAIGSESMFRHVQEGGPRRRSRGPWRWRRTCASSCLSSGGTMARKTHHKHSSTKGYRRLLDGLAKSDGVHRVATGRIKPRMGSGRPIAPISKVRRTDSGLSITINTDGAIVDAYVVTDRPEAVEEAMRERGWTAS